MDLVIESDLYNCPYENHSIAYSGDAGIDLFFPEDVVVPANTTKLIDLQIKCSMKYCGKYVNYLIYPRSSIYKTPLRMSNSIGIIDSMYRHNLKVAVDNISHSDYTIEKGTRLFQICHPQLLPIHVTCGKVEISNRGEGFGSSGV
jgi:dUTP pyrophosphatase